MIGVFSVPLGKLVMMASRLRGGGSALPGLVVERFDKNFLARTLAQLPRGVVLVSGTNGKTTTTKMVVELLEGQGLTVFTNRTGSNFTRGVVAALLGAIDWRGRLAADIAVLELDEAHAVHFANALRPRYSLLLNVMRDQLDRFGEIDATAKLLHQIAVRTTEAVVLNRDDPRLNAAEFLTDVTAQVVRRYGVADGLLRHFPSDDSMRDHPDRPPQSVSAHDDDTVLDSFADQNATISFAGHQYTLELQLKGMYNIQNAVGALALVRVVMQDSIDTNKLLSSFESVQPAFGRGETVMVDGQPCELVLVKNPSGFRLSLASFSSPAATMIAINDNYADGRDMSWLWDVDFETLGSSGVQMVSGVRAYDMALRLEYDEVTVAKVEPELSKALRSFIAVSPNQPLRIFCTYTAMLALRRELGQYAHVAKVRV